MAGCSKKQYAIMMSAGSEGKKLASEMGSMDQDKFDAAFSELLGSGAVKQSDGEKPYSREEDEDYGDFDASSDDDFGFDEEKEDFEESPDMIANHLVADPAEVTTDHYVNELEELRNTDGYDEQELIDKIAKNITNGYGNEDSLQFAIDDYTKELSDKEKEPNPMDEFSGPNREGPSYAQLEAKDDKSQEEYKKSFESVDEKYRDDLKIALGEEKTNKVAKIDNSNYLSFPSWRVTFDDGSVGYYRMTVGIRGGSFVEEAKWPLEKQQIEENIEKSQSAEDKPRRFTKSPDRKDYDINDELNKSLSDYEYYSQIEDIDNAIKSEKEWKDKIAQERFRDQSDLDKYDRRISMLSDPRIQKYVNDRNAYNKQFENDYQSYKDIAKQSILDKIFGDNDLYKKESYTKEGIDTVDDLYDSINSDFAQKYGYERTKYGDMFYPGRRSINNFLDDADRIDGTKSRKYNKEAIISDLLSQGVITIADLRKFLGK